MDEQDKYLAGKVYEHALKPHLRKSATISFFYNLFKIIRIITNLFN